jgi:hypothetical protein
MFVSGSTFRCLNVLHVSAYFIKLSSGTSVICIKEIGCLYTEKLSNVFCI